MSKERKPDTKPSDSGFVSGRMCDGCAYLRFEDRPHGVKAARCGNPEAGSGTIRGFGRTLEVFGTGEIGPVVRPKWCGDGRKRIATPVTSVTGSQ